MGHDEDEDALFELAMQQLSVVDKYGAAERSEAEALADEDALFAATMALAGARGEDGAARAQLEAQREAEAMAGEDAVFAAAMAAMEAPDDQPVGSGATTLGRLRGTPRSLRRRIKSGEISAEATLDLHRHTRDKAKLALRIFLRRVRADGLQVVSVITGRGLHSQDEAVLQKAVAAWLKQDFAKHVLQSVTAPAAMGGEGVTYLVLR